MNNTKKGFEITEFEDTCGVKCSLQMSSSAMEDKVWFGVNDVDAKVMVCKAREHGLDTEAENGWMKYPIPKDVLLSTRMLLNREQVEELLPYLKRFVETGDLHEPPHQFKIKQWTASEEQTLMNYVEVSSSKTTQERIKDAHYMMYNKSEAGHSNLEERTLESCVSRYYTVCERRQLLNAPTN
jgi:hypothetical protein